MVGYFGDTTGNSSYSTTDSQRASRRVVVGLDGGFAAFPTVDPVIIADITDNGSLSSTDAIRILQEVVGFDRAEISALPGLIVAGLAQDTAPGAQPMPTGSPRTRRWPGRSPTRPGPTGSTRGSEPPWST